MPADDDNLGGPREASGRHNRVMWSSWFGRFKLTRPAGPTLPGGLAGGSESLSALDSQPARRSSVLVLLDPGRLWPRSAAAVLADAGGWRCRRVDMRGPDGQRQVGLVERVALPMGPEQVKLYAVDHRAARHDAEALGLTLGARADLLALLLGPMDRATLAGVLRRLDRALQQAAWACPQLVLLLQGAAQRHREAILAHAWPREGPLRPRVQVLDTGHGAPAVLQMLQQAWGVAQGGGTEQPAGPASLEQLAQAPGVLAVARVDLAQGALLQGPADEALAHVARSLCMARSMQRFALGPGAPNIDEVLVTRADQLQLLRPCREEPGQGVLLLLSREADLAALRAALARLDTPGAQPLAA